ncbi:cell death regulator aven [Holotrichia oblita]|uniref:Cell death regulator aven n=1 Tax=Holotrichia oblita TaxID=644536 RepID=A0ACB9TAY6_HOLOL|nr:cell death regulator aven [Holotrichia oblita]
MDESKKINAGKYRNKQRYKSKAKAVHKKQDQENIEVENKSDKIVIDDSDLFQKRSLESNWYRYEAKEEDDKDTLKDFSILASAPIQQASYFQFKSDKTISSAQDAKPVDNKLFNLDVNLLSLSITTIPFHVRCGIDEKYFSENQLKYMRKEAEDNILKYKLYVEEIKDKVSNNGGDLNIVPKKDNSIEKVETDIKIPSQTVKNSEEEDLEEWLDDILDD